MEILSDRGGDSVGDLVYKKKFACKNSFLLFLKTQLVQPEKYMGLTNAWSAFNMRFIWNAWYLITYLITPVNSEDLMTWQWKSFLNIVPSHVWYLEVLALLLTASMQTGLF